MEIDFPINLFLLEAVRGINFLLLSAFLVHLLIRFRNKKTPPFFLSWILYWISFIAQYVVAYYLVGPLYTLYIPVSLLNSLFLLVSSELLLPKKPESKIQFSAPARAWLKWGISFILVIGLSLQLSDDWSIVIINYSSFLAIALYTGRCVQISPKTKEWVVIVLYVYAGLSLHNLVLRERNDAFLLTALFSLSIPLKVILYYTGYLFLLGEPITPIEVKGVQDVSDSRLASIETAAEVESVHEVSGKLLESTATDTTKVKASPPEPTVEIQFTGMWGFFYILWRYPSGKPVVVFIFAALMAAITFFAVNITTLITLFRPSTGK